MVTCASGSGKPACTALTSAARFPCARAVDERRAQERAGHAGSRRDFGEPLFGGDLALRVDAPRGEGVVLPEGAAPVGRAAVNADRAQEDEVPHAGACRGGGEGQRRLRVGAVIELAMGALEAPAAVGERGKVHDRVGALDGGVPALGGIEEVDGNGGSGAQRQVLRVAGGGDDFVAGEIRQKVPPDKARGARDQYARHSDRPQAAAPPRPEPSPI